MKDGGVYGEKCIIVEEREKTTTFLHSVVHFQKTPETQNVLNVKISNKKIKI